MVKKRVLNPQPVLDEALLSKALREEGIKEVHVRAAWSHALSEGRARGSDANFDGFEHTSFNMSAPARFSTLLRRKFAVLTSKVVETQRSEDGTVKLLIRLQDGQMVETVIIPHGGTHPRNTLCVSSQVGCQMACTFCATGTMGLKGDLAAGEILEQVLHASRVAPIRNVVFMGMGEPLNNYDAVLAAIRGMADGRMFKLSPRHITLSTVGVVPRMRQLTIDAPETQLALSLHAPNQELRNRIVPSARAYRLDKLMDALDGHLRGPGAPPVAPLHPRSPSAAVGSENEVEEGVDTIAGVAMVGGKGAGRRALIEYVMLAGVNDTEECGRQLGELLQGRNVVVNLIPYNPTYAPGSEEFREPTEEALQAFKKTVHEHGLLVTIRRHHGRDIDGACGQLAVKVVASEAGAGSTSVCRTGAGSSGGGDIEDLVARSNGGHPRATSGGVDSKRRLSRKDPRPLGDSSAVAGNVAENIRECAVAARERAGWSRRGRKALAGMALSLGMAAAVAIVVTRARRRG